MNMFGGFSVLGQALESLGSIVAPVPEEEDEKFRLRLQQESLLHEDRNRDAEDAHEGEDEDDNFDNLVRSFIQQKREETLTKVKPERKLVYKAPIEPPGIGTPDVSGPSPHSEFIQKVEPESPNSLVTITLDDEDSDRESKTALSLIPPTLLLDRTTTMESDDTILTMDSDRKFSISSTGLESPIYTFPNSIQAAQPQPQTNSTNHTSTPSSVVSTPNISTFSSVELEKKIQLKYRENLENSYNDLQSKHQELEQENHRLQLRLETLEQVCKTETSNTVVTKFPQAPSLITHQASNLAAYEKKIEELEAMLTHLQRDIQVKDERLLQQSSKLLQFDRLEKEKQELIKENQLLNQSNQDTLTNLHSVQQQYQIVHSQLLTLQQENHDLNYQLSFEKQLVLESEQLQQKNQETIQQLKQDKDKQSKEFQQRLKEKENQLIHQIELLEKYVTENDQVHEKYEALIDNHRTENESLSLTAKTLEEKLELLERNYLTLQNQHAELIHDQHTRRLHQSSSSSASSPIKQEVFQAIEPPYTNTTDTSSVTVGTSPIPSSFMTPSAPSNPYQDMVIKLVNNYLESITSNITQFCGDKEIVNPLPDIARGVDSSSPSEEVLLQYIFHSIQLIESLVERKENELFDWKDSSLSTLQILQKLFLQVFPEMYSEVQALFNPSSPNRNQKGISSEFEVHRILGKLVLLFDAHLRGYQEREKLNQELLKKELQILQDKESEMGEQIKQLLHLEEDQRHQLKKLSLEVQQKTANMIESEQQKSKLLEQLKQLTSSDQQSKLQLQQMTSETQQKLTFLSKLEQERDVLTQQFQEVKTKYVKADNENKQLLTVINQLRNARKDKTSENEQIVQELATIKQQYQQLQKESSEYKAYKDQYHHIATNYQLLQQDLQSKQKELSHLQQEIQTYEMTIQQYSSQLLTKEQSLYEKQQIIDNYQYEERLSKKSIEQMTYENQNLKDLIQDYEHQSSMELNLWKRKHADCLHQLETLTQAQEKNIEEVTSQLIEQFRKEKKELTNLIDEKTLQMKQLVFENNREKQLLQKNMEKTIAQMQNTSSNVVDKMLIGNLIVSYFQRRRSREVLELIAKVLQLNDEQLVIIGLKVANINYIQSFFQSVIGINPSGVSEEQPIEGSNLAELWVNYLIKQAEEPAKGKSPSQPIGSAGSASPKVSVNDAQPSLQNYNTSIMRSTSNDSVPSR